MHFVDVFGHWLPGGDEGRRVPNVTDKLLILHVGNDVHVLLFDLHFFLGWVPVVGLGDVDEDLGFYLTVEELVSVLVLNV